MSDDEKTEKRPRGRPGFDDPVRVQLVAERVDMDMIGRGADAAGMSRSAFMVHHAVEAARKVLKGK